jgi:hypothetical protein
MKRSFEGIAGRALPQKLFFPILLASMHPLITTQTSCFEIFAHSRDFAPPLLRQRSEKRG